MFALWWKPNYYQDVVFKSTVSNILFVYIFKDSKSGRIEMKQKKGRIYKRPVILTSRLSYSGIKQKKLSLSGLCVSVCVSMTIGFCHLVDERQKTISWKRKVFKSLLDCRFKMSFLFWIMLYFFIYFFFIF